MKDIAMHMALRGQLADSPLISNEQFSAGGVDSVRGYLESERQGDNAVQLNLELRSPPRTIPALSSSAELRAHGFIDAAWLNIREPLPGQQARYEIYSSGFGLRSSAWNGAQASLDIAWPFKDTAETQAGEPRLHFSVSYGF